MFLLRRNVPRAWAGWRDTFNRANESPIQKPWGVWGTQPCTAQIESNVLRFGSGSAWTNFGGWSYEHQPFTENWGVQFQMACTKSGAVAEKIDIPLTSPWSKVGPSFNNILSVAIQYRTSGVNCRVMVLGYANATAVGTIYDEAQIPQSAFDGSFRTYRIRVDQDRFVRVYYEGALVCFAAIPSAYRTGLNRRAANFLNGITTNVYIDNFELYDRDAEPPFQTHSWTSEAFDDFNRGNSNTVGNGWAEFGQRSLRIAGNSLAFEGTSDGYGGAWRSALPLSSGDMRVEWIPGGQDSTFRANVSTSILLRMNAAGTQAIEVGFYQSEIYFYRLSSATSASPSRTTIASSGATLSPSSGVKYAVCAVGDYGWVERVDTGEVVFFCDGLNAHATNANRYYGARIGRQPFQNAPSINEYRALVAA